MEQLNESQVTKLAKCISLKSLKDFYKDPKNKEAFLEWKAEKEKND